MQACRDRAVSKLPSYTMSFEFLSLSTLTDHSVAINVTEASPKETLVDAWSSGVLFESFCQWVAPIATLTSPGAKSACAWLFHLTDQSGERCVARFTDTTDFSRLTSSHDESPDGSFWSEHEDC